MKFTTKRPRAVLAIMAVTSLCLGGTAVAWQSNGPETTTQWDIEADTDGFQRHNVLLASQSLTGAGSDRGDARPGVRTDLDIDKLRRAQDELGGGGEIVTDTTGVYYLVGDQGRVVSKGEAWVLGAEAVSAHREAAQALNVPAPVEAPEVVWPSTAPVAEAPDTTRPDDNIAPLEIYTAATNRELNELKDTPGVEHVQVNADNTLLVTSRLSAEELENVPGVTQVEESVFVPVLAGEPNDPDFPYAWHLNNTGWAYQQSAVAGADVGALRGWEGSLGQGTIVAVVDTGYTTTHPDLQNQLWNNPTEACGSSDQNQNGKIGDCHGWNFYSNSSNLNNGTGGSHGTSVSGVVAASMNNTQGSTGLAPGARIMPLVVGSGSSVNVDMAAEAIRYAADNGADVINASFGGNFSGTGLQRLRDAVVYAGSKNVLVVAAAGNDSLNRDTSTVYPANFSESNVITVGSTNATDAIATHSAYGKTMVDLFAPGELIYTTWNDNGYRLSTGTSLAAPQVAAAAALHVSLNPNLSAADLRTLLMSTTTKKPAYTDKSVSGGRLSVSSLGGGDTAASYTFSRMGTQTTGVQSPQVNVSTTSYSGAYTVKFGLLMKHENTAWGVGDVPVTFRGATKNTAADGTVSFDLGNTLGAGTKLEPTFSLPVGQYALAVQVSESGVGLGRPMAAPLTVTDAPAPTPTVTTPNPTPTTTTPPPPGPTTPVPPGPTTPGPTTPGPTTPGPTTPGPTTPGPTTPVPPGPTTPGPTTPGPTTPGPTTPGPTTPVPPGPTTPGPTTPGPTTPGPTVTTPPPGPTTPVPPGPTTPGPTATTTPPPPGGGTSSEKRYPGTDTFKVTRVAPHRVSTQGGEMVRIEGGDLPSGLRVRVGASTTADIVGASTGTSSSITFEMPSMVAGTYDVTLSTLSGRSSVLSGAVLVENTGGSTPKPTVTTPPPPGPTTPGPTGTTTPKPTTPPPGPTPTVTTPPPGPGTTTVTGPQGQKLSRSDWADTAPSGLWDVAGCETSCGGVQL